jgi:hypothetical protein
MPNQERDGAFVFRGLAPYIEAAAVESGVDPEMAGRARSGWHVGAVQTGLAGLAELAERVRIGHAAPESIGGAVEYVKRLRGSVAAMLGGIDAAIEDTHRSLGLPVPRFARKPKQKD